MFTRVACREARPPHPEEATAGAGEVGARNLPLFLLKEDADAMRLRAGLCPRSLSRRCIAIVTMRCDARTVENGFAASAA